MMFELRGSYGACISGCDPYYKHVAPTEQSIADFLKHTTSQGCINTPLEGGNLTGIAIQIYNPKNGKNHFLQIYKGGEISKTTIVEICSVRLFIDLPKQID
jgi:hypothetical protein